jgi:hypothetical protein
MTILEEERGRMVRVDLIPEPKWCLAMQAGVIDRGCTHRHQSGCLAKGAEQIKGYDIQSAQKPPHGYRTRVHGSDSLLLHRQGCLILLHGRIAVLEVEMETKCAAKRLLSNIVTAGELTEARKALGSLNFCGTP